MPKCSMCKSTGFIALKSSKNWKAGLPMSMVKECPACKKNGTEFIKEKFAEFGEQLYKLAEKAEKLSDAVQTLAETFQDFEGDVADNIEGD